MPPARRHRVRQVRTGALDAGPRVFLLRPSPQTGRPTERTERPQRERTERRGLHGNNHAGKTAAREGAAHSGPWPLHTTGRVGGRRRSHRDTRAEAAASSWARGDQSGGPELLADQLSPLLRPPRRKDLTLLSRSNREPTVPSPALKGLTLNLEDTVLPGRPSRSSARARVGHTVGPRSRSVQLNPEEKEGFTFPIDLGCWHPTSFFHCKNSP